MNAFVKMLFENELENLEGFKLNGELVLKRPVVREALVEQLDAPLSSKEANVENVPKAPIPKAELMALFDHLKVHELSIKSDKDRFSLSFDVSK